MVISTDDQGTDDQDSTVGTSGNNPTINENAMNVKPLERRSNERIDSEMNNIVDTVEDRIPKAILIAIDRIFTPKIELAIRSTSASSGRDATSVSAKSECAEQVGINAPFENASRRDCTLRAADVNDETRNNIPDEVSELPNPETYLDRQSHAHHTHNFLVEDNLLPVDGKQISNNFAVKNNPFAGDGNQSQLLTSSWMKIFNLLQMKTKLLRFS